MDNILLKSGKVSIIKGLFSQKNRIYYKILLFQNCKGSLYVDGERCNLKGNTLMFCYHWQEVKFDSIEGDFIYAVFFQETFFYLFTEHKNLLFRMPFFGYPLIQYAYQLKGNQNAMLIPIMKLMEHEYKQTQHLYEQILLSYVNILLLKIKSFPWAKNELVHKNDYTTLQIVMKYKQLVRLHCRKHHFVSFYAGQLMLTSNYLNLMVKKVTGESAGQIIQQQLILEAKRLLIHTKLSPKEVAFDLGFIDHTYFSKFFKKRTGYNPLLWFNKHKTL